jgi:hypothetical protein
VVAGRYAFAAACSRRFAVAPDLVAATSSMGSVLIARGDVLGGTSYLSRGIALGANDFDTYSTLITSLSSESLSRRGISFIYANHFAGTGNVEKRLE